MWTGNLFLWEYMLGKSEIPQHRVWSKKNETNVLHDCKNTNPKPTNLIISANC